MENLAAIKQNIKIKDSKIERKRDSREQEKKNNKNRINKAEAG